VRCTPAQHRPLRTFFACMPPAHARPRPLRSDRLRDAYRQAKAAAAGAVQAARPGQTQRAPLLHKLSERTDQHLQRCASRPAGRRGPAGRGRLWPRPAVSLLRRRCAGAAARTPRRRGQPCKAQLEQFIGSCWDAGWKSAPACAPAECLEEAAPT
jgi:hypothetical protein